MVFSAAKIESNRQIKNKILTFFASLLVVMGMSEKPSRCPSLSRQCPLDASFYPRFLTPLRLVCALSKTAFAEANNLCSWGVGGII